MTTVYNLKLVAIDEYLLASGWTRKGDGWLPPGEIAHALRFSAPEWKTGTWKRCHAIMIQVQRDEAAAVKVGDGTLSVKRV